MYGVLNGFTDELDKGTSQLPTDPKSLDPDDTIKKIQEKALKMNKSAVFNGIQNGIFDGTD